MIQIKIQDNGYNAETVKNMMHVFEKGVKALFDECIIEHFYYGDTLIMSDIILCSKGIAHFNITKNRVALCGLTAQSDDEYEKFKKLTYRDECFKGMLFDLI